VKLISYLLFFFIFCILIFVSSLPGLFYCHFVKIHCYNYDMWVWVVGWCKLLFDLRKVKKNGINVLIFPWALFWVGQCPWNKCCSWNRPIPLKRRVVMGPITLNFDPLRPYKTTCLKMTIQPLWTINQITIFGISVRIFWRNIFFSYIVFIS
jgi:hypothetical protein